MADEKAVTEEGTTTSQSEEQKTFEPMPAKEMLSQIEEAIQAIMFGGQSYKIGSRQLTRADLKMLYQMRKEARAEIAAENQSMLFSDCYVGVFDGR